MISQKIPFNYIAGTEQYNIQGRHSETTELGRIKMVHILVMTPAHLMPVGNVPIRQYAKYCL